MNIIIELSKHARKAEEYAYERNKRYSMETFASRMEEVYNRALKKFW